MNSWKPRKNSAPPTPDDLLASLEAKRIEIHDLKSERREIEEHLPALTVAEPERAAEAQARLTVIDVELPVKQRAYALIESNVAAAKKRQALEAFNALVETQSLASKRMAGNLEQRYRSAAAEFAKVLQEMADDAQEWDRLRLLAQLDHSIRIPGHDAEAILRIKPDKGYDGFRSLHEYARVAGWDGSTLFEGAKV